jgi:hypothetical protein
VDVLGPVLLAGYQSVPEGLMLLDAIVVLGVGLGVSAVFKLDDVDIFSLV